MEFYEVHALVKANKQRILDHLKLNNRNIDIQILRTDCYYDYKQFGLEDDYIARIQAKEIYGFCLACNLFTVIFLFYDLYDDKEFAYKVMVHELLHAKLSPLTHFIPYERKTDAHDIEEEIVQTLTDLLT